MANTTPHTDENDGLTWDAPTMPHEYANVIVAGKIVVLVRHHFADTGDVEKIYNNYMEKKLRDLAKNDIKRLQNRLISGIIETS